MSKALWCVYENDIPKEFFDVIKSPEMKRIQDVGMHCGMEYTSFPFYKDFKPYSRYDHSIGVGLIVYHFTHDLKQSLAALFHDIATPVFAHVIDFLKGDYTKQEATEERTASIIENSVEIKAALKKFGLTTKDVSDYHLYPIADNDSPRLSADRLEYTLNNLLNYNFATFDQIKSMYDDLTITKNEDGVEELCFRHIEKASMFALLSIKAGKVYVADEDRYGMEYLARILKKAIFRKVLSEDDLYTTEHKVISKLLMDEESRADWYSFRNLHKVKNEDEPSNEFSFNVDSKKRFIDPIVYDKGRISSLHEKTATELNAFKSQSFDHYLVKVD